MKYVLIDSQSLKFIKRVPNELTFSNSTLSVRSSKQKF